MKYHVEVLETHVVVRFRLADAHVVGDAEETIYPGEEIFGVTYDQLRARGSGEFEVESRDSYR